MGVGVSESSVSSSAWKEGMSSSEIAGRFFVEELVCG